MILLERRQLGLAAVGAALASGCVRDEPEGPHGEVIVSAQGTDHAHYAVTGSSADAVVSMPIGFRGHGLAVHPLRDGTVVMVARRPGTTLVLADLATGEELARVEAAAGTHFFGHAVFSEDATRLYVTEGDIAAGQGLIGVRDGATLELIEHFPSYGVGPHELALMPDGDTLVIANGGILTRPETGRDKLNLDTMDPTLSYIDRHTGELLEEVRLQESKSSIRHLAVSADGTVAIGVQLQREVASTTEPVALGALHRRGEPLQLLRADELVWRAFDDYVGSVAVCDAHDWVALTSPHGNIVGFWRTSTGEAIGQYEMIDVCGAIATGDGSSLALSNSLGEVRFLDAETLTEDPSRRISRPELSWDNHMKVVVLP